MVRPGRDRLGGLVEVDETYWGNDDQPVTGRLTYDKALILIAAQAEGQGVGRIRLRHVENLSKATVHRFIADTIESGAIVRTDGLNVYEGLKGYVHDPHVRGPDPRRASVLLPRVHRVASPLKRWLLGTHQGAIAHGHLEDYLNEFTFRFNRRTSASRGKLFYRLAQQAVRLEPAPFNSLVTPKI